MAFAFLSNIKIILQRKIVIMMKSFYCYLTQFGEVSNFKHYVPPETEPNNVSLQK